MSGSFIFKISDLLGPTPAPLQLQLLSAREFEVGMITGIGAGKTRGLCLKALKHAVDYPGAKVLLGRLTFSEMVNTVKQPFFQMADPLHRAGWFVKPTQWDFREGTHYARLTNGSQFFFSNLDDPLKFRNEEYCVPLQSRALTRRGWKSVDELILGESMLAYNMEKGVKQWTPLEGITRTTGEVFEMTNSRLRLQATAGHRWVVNIKDGNRRVPAVEAIRATSQLNTRMNIRINAPMGDDEGVSFSADPLSCSKYKSDWTAEVTAMSSVQRRAFLAGFLLGDGWQTEDGQWAFAQLRGPLLDALHAAAFIEHDGMINLGSAGNKIGRPVVSGRFGKRSHSAWKDLSVRSVGIQPVWCPQTRLGTWVMKQGSTITITGNSMICGDQMEENVLAVWETLTSRVRLATVPQEAWQCIAAANDDGHNWMWEHFVLEPERHARRPDRCTLNLLCMYREGHLDLDGVAHPDWPCATRRFFHGTTLDNSVNLKKRYLSGLLARPKAWQNRMVYAKMESSQGRLLPSLHVIPHWDPPTHWPRYVGYDHALNAPACALWVAINTDGREINGVRPLAPYVYREYWAEKQSVDQHAAALRALGHDALGHPERLAACVMDDSAFSRTQSRRGGIFLSYADLYAQEGLSFTPATGNPQARVEEIKLAHARGLTVSFACEHLLEQAPRYETVESKSGEQRIKHPSKYHAIDALGYVLIAIANIPTVMVNDLDTAELSALRQKFANDPGALAHHEAERRERLELQAASERAMSGGFSPSTFYHHPMKEQVEWL